MEAVFKFFDKFGVNYKPLIVIVGLGMLYAAWRILPVDESIIFQTAFTLAPIWLPLVTFLLFYEYWLYYVQKEFLLSQGRVTLELKIPQETFKSPEAMELVLNQLYQTYSPDNHIQTYIDGKHPLTFSLELVSREGDVKFYMNVPRKKFKNMTETQMYAQYPGIEVRELDVDYTAEIVGDPEKFDLFSIHFGLKKADAYPIKTYIDFGLDKLPKEEEKIDPLTTILEMLGSIGPGEFYWIQILFNANMERDLKTGVLTLSPDWKKAARDQIQKIIKDASKRAGMKDKDGNDQINMMALTDGEKDTIKAIERTLGKSAFNVAIRGMYNARKGFYNPGERIGPLITCWRSFDDINRNQIGFRWRTDFDWNWWQDPKGEIRQALKLAELDEYKRRAYTSRAMGVDERKVMTSEELATVFHIPGKVATTPTLGRIPSKRAEAPSNLPIGSL